MFEGEELDRLRKLASHYQSLVDMQERARVEFVESLARAEDELEHAKGVVASCEARVAWLRPRTVKR